MALEAATSRDPHDVVWKVALGLVVVGSGVYLADPTGVVGLAVSAAIALASLAGLLLGPHWNGLRYTRPWTFLGFAIVCTMISVATRPSTTDAMTGPSVGTLEALATTGTNVCIVIGAFLLIRRVWAGHEVKYAALDAAMIAVSVASFNLAVLAIPVLNLHHETGWHEFTTLSYPLFDTFFVLVVAALGVTTAPNLVAYRFLTAALVARLLGDVAHAYLASRGHNEMPVILDVPILLCAGFAAVAALHPSVRGFDDLTLRSAPPWGRARVLVLCGVFLLPALGAFVPHTNMLLSQSVRVVALCLLGFMLLARAVAAVNAQARIQSDLERQVSRDPLTQLLSREKLTTRITRMLARRDAVTVSVLVIDVDGFRTVNNLHGHEVGDEMLRETARRIGKVAHSLNAGTPSASGAVGPGIDLSDIDAVDAVEDIAVGRIGGDEFAITIVDELDGKLAEILAADIVAAFRAPVRLSTGRFDASVSVGVSNTAQVANADAKTLLRDAGTALEEARLARGSGWARYGGFATTGHPGHRDIEHTLRRAVEEGRLVVELQPVIRLEDHAIVTNEAVLRWQDPQLRDLSMDATLALADEYGVLTQVMDVLLEEAIAAMPSEPHGVQKTSIPVAGRTLHDPLFVDQVASLLREHGVNPDRLWFMMSEETLSGGNPTVVAALRALSDVGVGFTISDFGSGKASLEALRIVPVDGLRIGRSLVDRIGRSGTESALRAASAVAMEYGIPVVAPGVESLDQERVLARCGVKYATGRSLGLPVPAARFIEGRNSTRRT